MSRSAEDPPDALLRNSVNVPLEISLAECLKIDDGKQQEIIVGQEKEVS